MDFGKVARGIALSAALVLSAGNAVAEETDAQRCAGYPDFDGARENFEALGKRADLLNEYWDRRIQHHEDRGQSYFDTRRLAVEDLSYCSGLTDKANELKEKGEELFDQIFPEPEAPGIDA